MDVEMDYESDEKGMIPTWRDDDRHRWESINKWIGRGGLVPLVRTLKKEIKWLKEKDDFMR